MLRVCVRRAARPAGARGSEAPYQASRLQAAMAGQWRMKRRSVRACARSGRWLRALSGDDAYERYLTQHGAGIPARRR